MRPRGEKLARKGIKSISTRPPVPSGRIRHIKGGGGPNSPYLNLVAVMEDVRGDHVAIAEGPGKNEGGRGKSRLTGRHRPSACFIKQF